MLWQSSAPRRARRSALTQPLAMFVSGRATCSSTASSSYLRVCATPHRAFRARARVRRATLGSGSGPESFELELLELHPRDPANMWDAKPAWCQPWSIVTTGVVLIAAPTEILHFSGWFGSLATVVTGAGVTAWWFVFLYAVPKQYAEYVADVRRRANSNSNSRLSNGPN